MLKANSWIGFIFFLVFVISFLELQGQNTINSSIADISKLPSWVKHSGKINAAVTWDDASGKHYVITSLTGEFKSSSSSSEDSRDSELYAYHYVSFKDSTSMLWRVYDFVKDCPLDIQVSFIKNTLQVTDLNNDGIAEIWVMYKLACRGDIGPCDMKVIMYQDRQKFAMRGQNKVQITEGEFYGGEYKFDKAFIEGPAVFRDFAKKLWEKNIMQTWD